MGTISVDKDTLMELRFQFARLLREVEFHNEEYHHVTHAQVVANAYASLASLEEALEQPSEPSTDGVNHAAANEQVDTTDYSELPGGAGGYPDYRSCDFDLGD